MLDTVKLKTVVLNVWFNGDRSTNSRDADTSSLINFYRNYAHDVHKFNYNSFHLHQIKLKHYYHTHKGFALIRIVIVRCDGRSSQQIY